MSVQSQIERIKANVQRLYDTLGEKGAVLPSQKTTDNLVGTVNGEFGGTPLGILNTQTKTITENGEYLPDEGYNGFSKVTVEVSSSPVTSVNTYGKAMATEYLQNLVDSCYDVSCFSLIDIEQNSNNDKTDIALTGDWVYKAADFNEQLEELLWPSHDKVYAMLSQI